MCLFSTDCALSLDLRLSPDPSDCLSSCNALNWLASSDATDTFEISFIAAR